MKQNVFTEPRVTLISQTVFDDDAVDRWFEERGIKFETNATADADALTEFSGRLCYMAFNEGLRSPRADQNRDYIRDNVVRKAHGSVAEHSTWSFVIDHVSRNLTHELVRHRVGTAYSQVSTRYVDQFNDKYFIPGSGNCLGVYIPPEVFRDADLYQEWMAVWEKVVETYSRTFARLRATGIESKTARSIARHILPGSAGTAIVFTVNARELDHIFRMRGSLLADDEIRRLTIRIFREVGACNLFAHWRVVDSYVGEYLVCDQNSDLSFSVGGIL